MRKAIIKGKEIIISEKAYQKMLTRFNVKNFKKDDRCYAWDEASLVNRTRCYMCDSCNNNCRLCAFGVFQKHTLGCFEALKSILNKYQKAVLWNKINLFDDEIAYYVRNKKSAEKLLNQIYSAIKEGFRPVKRRR